MRGFSDCIPTGKSDVKYEYDVRVKVVKIKHEFFCYECSSCGAVFRSRIPPQLKEKAQYDSRLQARAARRLMQFREDIKLLLLTRKIVFRDDTVIMVLAERACFRFYGDETIAYYTAHAHKDLESLDEDNVLNLMTADTKIMHDHNTVNYNEKYSFEKLE